ncbi:hypothetical protein REMIM1_CH00770 [Rhizobium etli bv. mimosae str. Mim1]|nr:hypothetical protein REMIM1_CH00770 [Rhizobium etli bv. mimosae str. Mim1]
MTSTATLWHIAMPGAEAVHHIRSLTENGIDDLQNLLADIRTWDGGIRQFLIDEQCVPEMIERVMADEASIASDAQPCEKCVRRTLTFDRGTEFSEWPYLQAGIGTQTWF